MSGDRRKYPTWEWLAVTAIGILIAVAAYAYTDTQKKIETKADKDDVLEMKQDMREIRKMLESHVYESGYGKIPKRRNE